MKKVTVLVDEGGKVIASYIPPDRRSVPFTADEPPSAGLLASDGQEVLDLELPDEDVPSEPGADFLETLQRLKDERSS
jgi:hypothetical protein